MASQKINIGSIIMCDDDLSSVYRKRNRYEKGRVDKVQNVYYGPSFDSDVLCIVTPEEEFEIDNEESKRQFCKIYTSSGVEGFIRRKAVRTVG
jgi:hypothetical protein